MDSFDHFETIIFADPSAQARLATTSTTSLDPSAPPIDFERMDGYTSHGFCVIA
uniref:Mating-type protein phb3 n=1 Tax=Hypsizygus marmoreus TaxID=39966 RepID=A0A7T7DKM5_HYPMA|nr:mating-type protein phb3 [Hypsizygus marmoreus]